MAAIDVYTAVRYWIRALRIRQLFVTIAWLVPTWWALTSWEWSRAAIEQIDSTSLRGLSLLGVACAVYLVAATALKLSSKWVALGRLKRIRAARDLRAEASKAAQKERYSRCDADELIVLRVAVETGLQSLKEGELRAAIPGMNIELAAKTDAAISRLAARSYLLRYSGAHAFGRDPEQIVFEDRVFREITEEPSLVGSERAPKAFGKPSRR